MMILDRFCFYRPDKHEYFGRVPITKMIYPTIGAMAFTQLFISIYYLTYHVWWWFIGLFGCVLALAALVYAVRQRFTLIVKAFLAYEVIFTTIFIVASIWMLALLCNPYVDSYIWRQCYWHTTTWNCPDAVRTQGGIYFPIFMFFAFINAFCLVVIYNYVNFLTRPMTSVNYNNQYTTPTRPAGVPPPMPSPSSLDNNNQQTSPTPPSGGVAPLSPSNLGQTTYTPYPSQPTMGTGSTVVGAYNTYNASAQQGQTTYNAYGAQQTAYTNTALNAPPLSPTNQHWDTQPQYQNTQQTQDNNQRYDVTPNW